MAQNAKIDSHGNVVLDVSYSPMEVDSNGVYHQEITPSWGSIICCLLPAPSFCCGLCAALDWSTTDVNLNAKTLNIHSHTGILKCLSNDINLSISDIEAVKIKRSSTQTRSGNHTFFQVVFITRSQGLVEIGIATNDQLSVYKSALRWNRLLFGNHGGGGHVDPSLDEMLLKVQIRGAAE